jgi:predicted amidohydrolase
MQNVKVTIASLRSILLDPMENLQLVRQACLTAHRDGARILFLPELMLTGHGGHPKMVEHAEPVPDGPLSQEMLELSMEHQLCICVGIAELSYGIVYNSQMVVDRGGFLGLQRKVNLSGDEYCYFCAGEEVPAFDIGEVRFGITICYDNHFPELALIHSLNHVDLILAPHAARTGKWPEELSQDFRSEVIRKRQASWEKVHRARAVDSNVYVLLNNAVGPSTRGLEDVVANHAGTVMGIDPHGEVFLRTCVADFVDEIVTVELEADKRIVNHAPSRNRRLATVVRLLQERLSPQA